MKKTYLTYLIGVLLVALTSCDLQTDDDSKLSGDVFWTEGTEADMEAFVNSMYYHFRKATMIDAAFLLYSGDLRCAPITASDPSKNKFVNDLATNDLNKLRSDYSGSSDYRSGAITNWKTFYQVIQQANIMEKEVDNAPIDPERKEYFKRESRFMRDLTYFFLVRNFGDVPYYTNAYNQVSLPRTDMLTVLQNVAADLKDMLDTDPDAIILPWTYTSAASKGIKASRAAVLALYMHVNMWLAGFDSPRAQDYYKVTVDAGDELVNRNGGAYYLLPLSQSATVFRGGSAEGIFEIAQNLSYSAGEEVFKKDAVFSNLVMFSCFSNQSTPTLSYTYEFMLKAYDNLEDGRITEWFDDNYLSAVQTKKEITKFKHTDTYDEGEVTSNAGNQIVFRLADAILLYAEALAELGTDDAKACELLNMIRQRALVEELSLSGQDLKDAIYWERVRELIGEGHYFYDLVRTGKICDSNFCFNTISRSDFNRGAWTWPIHKNALDNNPRMQLNLYWE